MAGERDRPATGPADCCPIAIRARYRGIDGPDCVGGDFYARCEAADRIRIVLGDVRGKGAPAAGKARLLTETFLASAAACAGLDEVSHALDRVACADAAAEADPAAGEWFATAVLLEIDADGRYVTMINHGHPSPLLVGPDTVRELAPTRPRLPLGLGRLIPAPGGEGGPSAECGADAQDGPGAPPADTVELPPDSTLILFTDGLSEARDRTGRMFDPVAWLAQTPDLGRPSRLLDRLYLEAERHNEGSWRDDLALVSVRRRTAGAEAPTRQPVPPQVPKRAAAPRPSPRSTGPRTTTVPRPAAPRPALPNKLPDSDEHPPIPSPTSLPSPLAASKLPARPPAPTPTLPVSTSTRHSSDPSATARSRPRLSAARPAPPARPSPPARPARPT
jgi:Stage II sporulation protein E (SpoIIE)